MNFPAVFSVFVKNMTNIYPQLETYNSLYFFLFVTFNRAQPFLHVLNTFATGGKCPPIHGKDSILLSPLGRFNKVYDPNIQKSDPSSLRQTTRVGHIPTLNLFVTGPNIDTSDESRG